jgi:hypothetical protein
MSLAEGLKQQEEPPEDDFDLKHSDSIKGFEVVVNVVNEHQDKKLNESNFFG